MSRKGTAHNCLDYPKRVDLAWGAYGDDPASVARHLFGRSFRDGYLSRRKTRSQARPACVFLCDNGDGS